jgi:hypothetical protein
MARSFEDAGRLGREFLRAGLDSLAAVSRDAQAIAVEASSYATGLVASGGETIGKLMSAPSMEKAVEIQAAYLEQTYEGLVAAATSLGALYVDMAKDGYQPFEAVDFRTK